MKEEIFGNHFQKKNFPHIQNIVPSVGRRHQNFFCVHIFLNNFMHLDIFSIIDLDSSEEVQADTAEYMIYKISEKP